MVLLKRELGGADIVDLGVGVVGSALSLADGQLGNVVSLWPLLSVRILSGLSLDLEINAVDVRSKAAEGGAGSDDVSHGVLDGEDELSASGGVGDLEAGAEVDAGVSVAWVGADVKVGEVGGTVVGGVANGQQLAGVEGVQVDLGEDLDEQVDSDDVAQQAAHGSQGLVWQHSAEGGATSDNAAVGDDLNQVLDGLLDEGDAGWAQVKSGRLVLGDDDLTLGGDGDSQGWHLWV